MGYSQSKGSSLVGAGLDSPQPGRKLFFRFKLNPSTTQRTSAHTETRIRVLVMVRVRIRQEAEVTDRVRVTRPWVLCEGLSLYDRASGQIP